MTTETAQESSVVITETAAVKVRTLLDQEGRDDLNLRIAFSQVVALVCVTSCSLMTAVLMETFARKSMVSVLW
jgi:Fe-S cluster assembly iron-binding protein IscA